MQEGYVPASKKLAMKSMATILSKPGLYRIAGISGRYLMKMFPFLANNRFNPWYKKRDMPEAPKESFKEWYSKNKLKKQ